MFHFIRTLQSAVDAAAQFRSGIRRIERLIRIHRACGISVGRHLPTGEIDRLQPRTRHLHGLVAGYGTKRVDIGLVL